MTRDPLDMSQSDLLTRESGARLCHFCGGFCPGRLLLRASALGEVSAGPLEQHPQHIWLWVKTNGTILGFSVHHPSKFFLVGIRMFTGAGFGPMAISKGCFQIALRKKSHTKVKFENPFLASFQWS